jgi:hypothetical protein
MEDGFSEIIDNAKCGFYLIGLVDILGQKKKLKLFNDSKNPPEDFINAVRPIHQLRKTFENFFIASQNKLNQSNQPITDPELAEIYDATKSTTVNLQGFSDTVVFYVDLSSSRPCYPVISLYSALLGCGSAALISLAGESIIRGGIDVEYAGQIYSGQIYGTALNCAYYLENEVAFYPRILIGAGLMDYLDSFENLHLEDLAKITAQNEGSETAYYINRIAQLAKSKPNVAQKAIDILQKFAKESKKLIADDFDGMKIFDYLRIPMLQGIDENKEEIIRRARAFIVREKVRFESEKNFPLIKKYSYLEKYFSSKLSN